MTENVSVGVFEWQRNAVMGMKVFERNYPLMNYYLSNFTRGLMTLQIEMLL